METVKIVGIREGKNKEGKSFYNYFFTQAFSQYDVDNAVSVQGISTGKEFSYSKFPVNIGDEVELQYTKGFQDRAQLVGMRVVTPAKSSK